MTTVESYSSYNSTARSTSKLTRMLLKVNAFISMIVGVARQNTTVVRPTHTNLFLFSAGLFINRLSLGYTCVIV